MVLSRAYICTVNIEPLFHRRKMARYWELVHTYVVVGVLSVLPVGTIVVEY